MDYEDQIWLEDLQLNFSELLKYIPVPSSELTLANEYWKLKVIPALKLICDALEEMACAQTQHPNPYIFDKRHFKQVITPNQKNLTAFIMLEMCYCSAWKMHPRHRDVLRFFREVLFKCAGILDITAESMKIEEESKVIKFSFQNGLSCILQPMSKGSLAQEQPRDT